MTPPGSPRVVLRDSTWKQRLAFSTFWLFMAAVAVRVLWEVAHDIATSPQISVAGTACVVALVLAMNFFAWCGLLSTLRDAAWLAGSALTVRGAFSTRTVDLAASTVQGQVHDTRGGPSIYLVARDVATGRTVELRMGTGGRVDLTPQQLDALADAVLAGAHQQGGDGRHLLLSERLRMYYRRPAQVGRYLWADPS
ncbi:hypothetical protein [Catellatospora sp. TT07R-123]|uniref:hypothetical protein n=1 Tax=Catellatospora sp. TT07R-123 TaxID=2733863 RepID=UPI001BB32C5C|nr:hypothetical protein [Catellatospora sp. TT07R-123]